MHVLATDPPCYDIADALLVECRNKMGVTREALVTAGSQVPERGDDFLGTE